MSGLGVSSSDDLKSRAKAKRDQFAASGTTISDWARARGFSVSLTTNVLAGNRRCVRGASHQIAVALGIKDEVPPPSAQAPVLPDGQEASAQ